MDKKQAAGFKSQSSRSLDPWQPSIPELVYYKSTLQNYGDHTKPIEFDDATDSRERAAAPSYWQCQSDGPLDFIELFSESTRLSNACAKAGLNTGSPIDLRKGSAVYTRQGRQQIWDVIQGQKPLIVFMFPESAPWMWIKSKRKKAE